MSENEFVRHDPCSSCGSSDAFAVYTDGGGYCFSCGHHEFGDSEFVPSTKSKSMISYEGDFAGIRSRRLSEDTCKKFNVRVAPGPVIRFPYYSKEGRVVGYKERNQDKDFTWTGKNEDHQLFGQQLFGKGKSIVITEGELDALSVWHARPKWPVVSVPNGAKGAAKALARQLDWLLGFDEIILMFDTDEAGVAATEECVALFPHDKVFVAHLGEYKDASEALVAGDGAAIMQAYFNRQSYSPKQILDGRNLFDLVSSPLHGRDADYPYTGLNEITGGLRLGELVTLTAGSGTGKSTLCGEIASHLIAQDQCVGYIALEESVQRTGLRVMTTAANKPLHIDNNIDAELFRKSFDSTIGSGRFFLRDGFGSCDPDSILNDIRFLVKVHDVKWVILDHLSILVSGLDTGDERKMIDVTLTKIRSFIEETGIGIVLVSHLRNPQGDKGHEDGGEVSINQLRGSGGIKQMSDMVVALQRDIKSGDNSAELHVLKNRHTGRTGPAGNLSYSLETGRLLESNLFTDTTTTPNESYGNF